MKQTQRTKGRPGSVSLRVTVMVVGAMFYGCSTAPTRQSLPSKQALPTLQGSYHQVHSGETLWRIAYLYGLDVKTLADANRLSSTGHLKVGQRLFVPLPVETNRFLWPVFGSKRVASSVNAVKIAAPAGSFVRASRHGRVAVATRQLSGWGKTIVVDHLDGYVTIYAGLDQILVSPGSEIRQGTPIGSLGSQAFHFEIRYGLQPAATVALLPAE